MTHTRMRNPGHCTVYSHRIHMTHTRMRNPGHCTVYSHRIHMTHTRMRTPGHYRVYWHRIHMTHTRMRTPGHCTVYWHIIHSCTTSTEKQYEIQKTKLHLYNGNTGCEIQRYIYRKATRNRKRQRYDHRKATRNTEDKATSIERQRKIENTQIHPQKGNTT